MASRLLIIEDDLALLALYQLILEPESLDIVVTSSSFLDTTEVEQIHPDLILLDDHPGANGRKEPLLHRLKNCQATASIPLILATADAQAMHEQADYLTEHHVLVLLKPFEMDDLLQAVHHAFLIAPLMLFGLILFFS